MTSALQIRSALEERPDGRGPAAVGGAAEPQPMFDLMELFFFAYRDFVGDADRLLEAIGFGRAHHRVLHFVNRRPGLTIAELLEILRITKQSLARVLKDLVGQGFVDSRPGVADRRQRLLFPTAEGRRLALDLARVQSERFERVLNEIGEGARPRAIDFLFFMIDPPEREHIASLVWPSANDKEALR
jgi:DNA-binding MarR family transcriptional regulator